MLERADFIPGSTQPKSKRAHCTHERMFKVLEGPHFSSVNCFDANL